MENMKNITTLNRSSAVDIPLYPKKKPINANNTQGIINIVCQSKMDLGFKTPETSKISNSDSGKNTTEVSLVNLEIMNRLIQQQ